MAITTCLAAPYILPANFMLSIRSKAHRNCNVVALSRSNKISSRIRSNKSKLVSHPTLSPRLKTSRISVDIMRTISKKDDGEIEAELNRLRKSWEMLKEFFREIILVLMATNPILLRLSDAMVSDDHFIRWSSVAASYGALIVFREFIKVLWKAQPIWGFVIVGFLMYQANMCNIELYRKGRYPVWLNSPLAVIATGKLIADGLLVLIRNEYGWTPLSVILALIEIIPSLINATYFDHYFQFPLKMKN